MVNVLLFDIIKGERGGLRSKNQILYVLTYFKIWNTRIQELFTELKNIDFQARTVPLKSGHIAKYRKMYRISHIIKNGLKISFGTRFLRVG